MNAIEFKRRSTAQIAIAQIAIGQHFLGKIDCSLAKCKLLETG
jgi:hypothetical protein